MNDILVPTSYSSEEVRNYISDVRMILADEYGTLCDDHAMEKIEKYVFSKPEAEFFGYAENMRLVNRIFLSLRAEMDILQPLVDDETITEIMVNGKDHVFIERNGQMMKTDITFHSTEDLEELIRRIVSRVHREINELNPIVDARLSDGSRVNAVYKNVAINGPILTIRKFPDKVMSMDDLLEGGTLTREAAEFLKVLVKAGYN